MSANENAEVRKAKHQAFIAILNTAVAQTGCFLMYDRNEEGIYVTDNYTGSDGGTWLSWDGRTKAYRVEDSEAR